MSKQRQFIKIVWDSRKLGSNVVLFIFAFRLASILPKQKVWHSKIANMVLSDGSFIGGKTELLTI